VPQKEIALLSTEIAIGESHNALREERVRIFFVDEMEICIPHNCDPRGSSPPLFPIRCAIAWQMAR
jgi:hypothetical protein